MFNRPIIWTARSKTLLRNFAAAVLVVHVASGGRAHGEDLVDPTRPINASSRTSNEIPASAPLHLQAILTAEHQRSAIIDGQLVHTGDRLGNALIGQITIDSVYYTRAGHALVAILSIPQRMNIRPATVEETDR